ncbi:hypothetical protein BV22DRAFT_1198873 [Leucogyrophana mollusca]|uniref:Uncharacterized protein n=1 Tax=Leucogyrophana mollusca TaxID=85980 RepID=A0ACB8B438_9AGAM|nr:hypothetical protein BV22DRAFT_1198873 [Leucogyrophana mollusca]
MGTSSLSWSTTLKAVVTLLHSTAISSTLFRLSYRGYTLRFWWEDAWATLALVSDVICLTCVWLLKPVGESQSMPFINIVASWAQSMASTCVLWATRMSIMFAIIRVAGSAPKTQRLALCILGFFGLMWLGILAQKIYICDLQGCVMKQSLAISQLITDTISDAILVAMPFRLLRDVKLSNNRRILISSAFSASILITIITIFHSVLLFGTPTALTVAVAHVKAAASLIVCNLLVIVTFMYRAFRRFGGVDLDHSFIGSGRLDFTSIDLNQLTTGSTGVGGGDETNGESSAPQEISLACVLAETESSGYHEKISGSESEPS